MPHVPRRSICCRVRRLDDPHPPLIRDDNFDSLPKIEGDTARRGDLVEPLMLVNEEAGWVSLQNEWPSGWSPLATHE